MTAEPDPALAACMLQRAGDLAHRMLMRRQQVAVTMGTTPNGHPCTVIYAIGDYADVARDIGARLCADVAKRQAEERGRAQQN